MLHCGAYVCRKSLARGVALLWLLERKRTHTVLLCRCASSYILLSYGSLLEGAPLYLGLWLQDAVAGVLE